MTRKRNVAVAAADVPFAAPDWPATRVESWRLDRIKMYPNNPRTHPKAQIDQLARDMREDGVTMPILVDEAGVIIAGHGRFLASKQNGFEEYPVVIARGWTEERKRAVRLKDNAVAMMSGWDRALITAEIGELKLSGYDVNLLGFNDIQLRNWGHAIGADGAQDPEKAPPPPAKPVVRRGDLWVLGGHRILCGDSTSESDVARCVGDEKAVLMNTDPPYGINYGDIANSRSRAANVRKTHDDKMIENDDLDGVKLQAFLEKVIRAALPHLIDKPAFYLWHPMLTQGTFFAAAAAADILIHRQIIWVKPSLIMGRGHYHWRHELCFYGWVRGRRCVWYGAFAQDTVWAVDREFDNIHPTQKPTDLFRRPIENHTKPGEIVYEPFSGSGSQIIAAEMTKRRCFAIELDPRYVQVAIERWQKFAGLSATLDGKTFQEVSAARAKGKPNASRGGRESIRRSIKKPARGVVAAPAE